MTVDPGGAPCGCGSVGCWETVVGGGALLERAGRSRESGRAGIDAVLRDAADGSEIALAALYHVGRWLGIGLASLVNVLDPRLIVLGGLFGRIHAFVIGPLTRELDRRTLPASRALVRVVPATLGVDAPLLGAAELAFEALLTDPAMWLAPRDAVAELASA
jgi:predicted NBD/HSP70 family sugar kinase